MSLLVADVRALAAGEFESLVVFGGSALDDGGGGLYYWDAAATNADDGAEWIKPTAVDAGSPGRWHRIEPYALPTHNHDAAYISVVATPTTGNFPVLTAGGELNNSTYSNATFATAAQGTLAGTALQPGDVDDTAVNGATTAPVSSNWAFDHAALTSAHGGPYNLYVHPNHSGDVTSVADGATTIATGVVTNAKLANVATQTIKGRTTAATGVPEDLTATQTRTLLNVDEIGTARPPASHTHGNITNVGAVGTTANLPLITTTSGVIIASSFGTGANTFCQGNDARLHTAVTLSGTPDYITLVGQDIIRGLVVLTTDVSGTLPIANGGTGATTAATAFTALKQAASTTATGVVELATDGEVAANVVVQGNDGRLHAAITLAGTPDYLTLAGQVLTRALIDLTTDVTGLLPAANIGVLTTATEAGTTRTNTSADRNQWVRWTSASAKTFTITTATPAAGDVWQGINTGAGVLTLVGSGVTLTGTLTFAQNKSYSIRFVSTSAADVVGGA